jgi:hypothetical protein
MAFFKEAPIKTVTRDRDNAKANVDRLAARAVEAEKAVTARRSEAQQLAFDNADDAMLAKAEAALRGALDRQSTIGAASAEAGKLLVLLETQLADLLDKKVRAATSAEVLALVDRLSAANEATVIAMTELADVTGRVAVFIAEARGVEVFATSALIQIPEAVSYISRALREHGAGVLRGEGAPSLCSVAVFVPPVEPVQPKLVQVFLMNAIRYTDHAGVVRLLGKWCDVELSPEAAARALERNLAIRLTDPRCNQLRGQSPGAPSPSWCVDLDAAAEPIEHEPASQFTPINRGGPYKIAIARTG